MRFQNEKKSRGSKVMASQSLKSSKKCMYEERITTSFLFCSAVSNPIRLQLSEKLDSDICDVLQRWGFHFSLRSKKKARVTRAKGRVLGSLKRRVRWVCIGRGPNFVERRALVAETWIKCRFYIFFWVKKSFSVASACNCKARETFPGRARWVCIGRGPNFVVGLFLFFIICQAHHTVALFHQLPISHVFCSFRYKSGSDQAYLVQ